MNAYATFLIGATILLLLLIYVGTAMQNTKRKIGTLLIILTTISALFTVKQMGIALAPLQREALRMALSEKTWKPPESVRIGRCQAMKSWRPPKRATRSAPGRR